MATAKALEETTVVYCSEKDFERKLAGSDVVIRGVMAILSDRLRELQKRR
jgi:CRP-like cAMP-binding protein